MKTILLTENKIQWEKLLRGTASMTVRRSRPERVELPCKVLVCVDGKIVGGAVVRHFLKTNNPKVFSHRAATPGRELEEYAAEGPAYGWDLCGVEKLDRPMELAEIGVEQEPVSWAIVEVKDNGFE